MQSSGVAKGGGGGGAMAPNPGNNVGLWGTGGGGAA